MTSSIKLNSKQHYMLLDGLRGIAALAIVVFHFIEMYILNPENPIAHAYLAVDFFFCLSGFVVAYAYDDRVENLGFKNFFKLRLIRLHPLVILGSILGLLAFIFDPFGIQWQNYSTISIFIIFIASIFVIPYPVISERAFNLFGLNAPSWTLFWEYIANILYAIFLHRLKKQWLLLLAMLFAIGIVYTTWTAGDMSGGWGKSTYPHGALRIGFSFLIGMCIFRYKWLIKNNLNFSHLALLLALCFFIPYDKSWNWLSESLMIIVVFPLFIALGAGTLKNNSNNKICKFFGDMSYPLYITHYFVIWSFLNFYEKYQPSTAMLMWVIPSTIVLQIFVAYLSMRYYDLPIRKWLMKIKK